MILAKSIVLCDNLSMNTVAKSNLNIVYNCHYHVVFCPKYRRKVLVPPIDARLKQILNELVEKWGQELVELEVMPDHVHILLGCEPPFGIHKLVRLIKGASSRMLRQAFTYRLYPTRKQADTSQFTLDRNRELYNASLEERKEAYRMSKMSISYEDQSAQLPEIKEIRPEYQEIYSQVLQDTLKRVDKAFKAFFKRCKECKTPGFPRFHGYDRYNSFTYPQIEKLKQNPTVRIENGKVVLPKIGHIKVKQHRPMIGKAKTATIKREGEHWYVVFAASVE